MYSVGGSVWMDRAKLCAGCKNCANVAPDTFEIEDEFGRARVHCQLGSVGRAQEAIETW